MATEIVLIQDPNTKANIVTVNSDGSLNLRLYGSDGNPIKVDPTTYVQSSISYHHTEIHGGSAYYTKEINTLAINTFLDIQIVTPNTTKWGHWEIIFATSSEHEYWFYRDVNIITPGTAVTPRNRNENSSNTAGLTVAHIANTTEANANGDTAVAAAVLLAHGKCGSGRQIGGGGSSRQEIILKQNIAYSLRFKASAAGYVDWLSDWYEHTNK